MCSNRRGSTNKVQSRKGLQKRIAVILVMVYNSSDSTTRHTLSFQRHSPGLSLGTLALILNAKTASDRYAIKKSNQGMRDRAVKLRVFFMPHIVPYRSVPTVSPGYEIVNTLP